FIHSYAGNDGCVTTGTHLDLRKYYSPSQIDSYRIQLLLDQDQYPVKLYWPPIDSMYSDGVILSTPDGRIDMKAVTTCEISNPGIHFVNVTACGPRPLAHAPTVFVDRPSHTGMNSAILRVMIN